MTVEEAKQLRNQIALAIIQGHLGNYNYLPDPRKYQELIREAFKAAGEYLELELIDFSDDAEEDEDEE